MACTARTHDGEAVLRRDRSPRVDCKDASEKRVSALKQDKSDQGQPPNEHHVASEQRRMLRLHRYRGGWTRSGPELDAEHRRGCLHERRRARADILGEPRAAARGPRGRDNHALAGIAAGGLGSVPRADPGSRASPGVLPCMGGASGENTGPTGDGRMGGLLRRDVGPVVSAPIRRRGSVPVPCSRHQDDGHGGDGGRATARPRNRACANIGVRLPRTRTSRSRTPSSSESCS